MRIRTNDCCNYKHVNTINYVRGALLKQMLEIWSLKKRYTVYTELIQAVAERS